ncbi:MAG TPA: hypothetical protein VLS28_01880 [Candidatus Sulfomarinibacteraceae bacterium]|nr:hypothetical protein [Candidatus Sulfomarinibacteraceae bacterium]
MSESRADQAQQLGRWSTGLAVIALLLWPLSYAWVPMAGRNPGFIMVLVPIAEIGSLVLASAAVILAYRARRLGRPGRSRSLGLWLGSLVIVLVIGGSLVAFQLAG